MKISDLSVGEKAKIMSISGHVAYRQKLLSMRLLPKVEFIIEQIAPLGCPIKLLVGGNQSISLRAKEAEVLEVDRVYV